mmetsp:Transcript_58520/g.154102  ORF Transcript_58520/g.154102 Transcript_58520/m.154102 type:complete len:241 (+) Transcript_58520:433-1155(+)
MLLRKLVLDLGLELGLKARVLQVLLHDHQHLAEPGDGVAGDQHGLQLIPRRGGHASDEVRKLQRVVEVVVLDHLLKLLFVHEVGLEQVLHRRNDFVVQRADVVAVGRHHVRDVVHEDGAERRALRWRRQRFQELDAPQRHNDHLPAVGARVRREADDLQQRPDLHQLLARVHAAGVPAEGLRRGVRRAGALVCHGRSGRHRQQGLGHLPVAVREDLWDVGRHEAGEVLALPVSPERVEEV